MQKGMISFANIDENVCYKVVPQDRAMRMISCTDVTDIPLFLAVSQDDIGDNRDVEKILDGDINIQSHKYRERERKIR